MAKSREPFELEGETPPPEESMEAKPLPDCPEGMDEAIFRQGALDKRAGKKETDIPFQEGSHQGESWAAGFAAG